MKSLLRALCALTVLFSGLASAHVANEAYLTLQVHESSLSGEWVIKLADLGAALQLDANGDGEIKGDEIEPRKADIEDYLRSHLHVVVDEVELGLAFDRLLFGSQNGEDFILTRIKASVPEQTRALGVQYTLLAELDGGHSCHLKIEWPDKRRNNAVISAETGLQTFTQDDALDGGFMEFLRSGVWHIWIGYDHILFLLVLLIPAVYQRTRHGREPASRFGSTLLRVVVIVSAFTVAHSITLSCAMLDWIRLPSRFVESAIAASVVLAALHNFLPRTAGGRGAWLAFAFGLLHGFGFAGALSELDLSAGPIGRTLLAFNLGVELGQLAIVAAFLPIAFALRKTAFYRVGVLYVGSALACLCAAVWFVQRAFE
jgi:hypothetical protein